METPGDHFQASARGRGSAAKRRRTLWGRRSLLARGRRSSHPHAIRLSQWGRAPRPGAEGTEKPARRQRAPGARSRLLDAPPNSLGRRALSRGPERAPLLLWLPLPGRLWLLTRFRPRSRPRPSSTNHATLLGRRWLSTPSGRRSRGS